VKDERTAVTRLLERVKDGDRAALDEVFAILYDELGEIARRQRRRWQGNATLDTTALIHEAYVKLVGLEGADLESRAHFRALASRAMRHILCDYARHQGAQRRGGEMERLTLDERAANARAVGFAAEDSDALVALDEALQRLEAVDRRQGDVVECRFFGGLTVEETATALGISTRTVKRDWSLAQAWLHREMSSPS
jgi:RNA polymerase sigma factor (TIGR02999 family)